MTNLTAKLTGRLWLGLLAVFCVAALTGWQLSSGSAHAEYTMSVEQAHQAAVKGDLILVDIRRPDEWARTGIGEGAVPLDMRRSDFIPALSELSQGQAKQVALICAGGVRSARLARKLAAAGFAHIIDIPEGMEGSRAGPGWVAKGLPLRPLAEKG